MTSTIVPHSIADLAAAMGLTTRTLQRWCRQADTTAKACVDLVLCLRVLLSLTAWNPRDELAMHGHDGRTVDRLLRDAALDPHERPTIKTFLARQRLVTSTALCGELLRALEEQAAEPANSGMTKSAHSTLSICSTLRSPAVS